jgi:raffinose/stachyose/melibiose transport system permease protein
MVLKSGLTVFDYIQAMTAGGPMQSTESAGVLIYQLAFNDGKAGFASAYAVLLLMIIGIVSVLQMKISSKIEVGQL